MRNGWAPLQGGLLWEKAMPSCTFWGNLIIIAFFWDYFRARSILQWAIGRPKAETPEKTHNLCSFGGELPRHFWLISSIASKLSTMFVTSPRELEEGISYLQTLWSFYPPEQNCINRVNEIFCCTIYGFIAFFWARERARREKGMGLMIGFNSTLTCFQQFFIAWDE